MKTLKFRPLTRAVVAATLGCVFGAAPLAMARDDGHDDKGKFTTELSGYNEVHFVAAPTPALRGAISTKATGNFKATIDDAKQLIHYELNYQGLEGAVTQSHIHFGQRHTVGGIVVWLCQTDGTPAPANVAAVTPKCPPNTVSGPVTGTIASTQVLAQTAQGIDAGEFEELVRAIRAGATYVNVHSTLFPPGEIRGHLGKGKHHHNH
jgi:hypothetical protein